MKRTIPCLLVLFCLALTQQNIAQVNYQWVPEQAPSCTAGTSLRSVEDLTLYSSGCTDVELLSTDEFIRITSSDVAGDFVVFGRVYEPDNTLNQLPGDISTSGDLTWTITGDLSLIDLEESYFQFVYEHTETSRQRKKVTIAEMLSSTAKCATLVAGGAQVYVNQFFIKYNSDWVDGTPVDIGLAYTYEPLGIPTVTEINATDASFDGTEYHYDLPLGEITFVPEELGLKIGLENNTPTAQAINVSKTGGSIILSANGFFEIQESTSTSEKHQVNFDFTEVDFCLGEFEFFVASGANIILDNSIISYASDGACIMIHGGAVMTVPENGYQNIGESGVGMHVWADGARTVVRENAILFLDNSFNIQPAALADFDVFSGGHLEVTGNTSIHEYSLGGVGSLSVNLYDGATFDMSAAPAEVQELFTVNTVSSSADVLAASEYSIFPNPSTSSKTFVRSTKELRSIEVVDLSGRVVYAQSTNLNGGLISIDLPSVGMHTIRLTDSEGRVGHSRVVRQ
ncbi:MAG: T9SS type A sorting domain-containing protein [Saprospiraceae bacterium]